MLTKLIISHENKSHNEKATIHPPEKSVKGSTVFVYSVFHLKS